MHRSLSLSSAVLFAFGLSSSSCKESDDAKTAPPAAKTRAHTGGDTKHAPSAEPAAPKPPAAEPKLHEEEISYKVDDVEYRGFLAYDENITSPRPGVLVVHEWWGHNDYARKRVRMLAKLGYSAFALDMYGGGKQAAHPGDAQKFASEVSANMDQAVKRFEAARKLLSEHASTEPGKLAAVGYCFGGGIVLHMARTGMDLKGVASFHGSLTTKAPAKKGAVKARLLVLNGKDDPFVKAEHVEALKKEMADAEAEMAFFDYPGAVHAFTNPGATELGKKFELPLAYNQAADESSWAELEKFLKQVFSDAG